MLAVLTFGHLELMHLRIDKLSVMIETAKLIWSALERFREAVRLADAPARHQ